MELSYSFHLGNDGNKSIKARQEAKNTPSGTTSKSNNAIQNVKQLGKVNHHNLRQYDNNQELIHTLTGSNDINKDVKELYLDLFEEARIEYNNKQVRDDRKIDNYFNKIANDDKHDLACEIIIELGDMVYWNDKSLEDKYKMIPVFEKQLKDLKEIVPDFYIANATCHFDEHSPHVNDKIRMYKKWNIKMHNFVHSFVILLYNKWRYNMEDLNKLKQELMIMKTNSIKPNYSELARLHNCDRRTVKKYDEGYTGKPINRDKESKLDKYREDIKIKLDLPGSTIKGTYQYFKEKDNTIGDYSNFYKYVIKNNLKGKKNNKFHPRYETDYGKQLQFDWKEDIKMFNKHGEVFEFNIFSSTLGASRMHVFIYSKFKTRNDVQRCLIKTFQYLGGMTTEALTDNMSSIVDTKKKEFYKEFKSFSKDIGFEPKKCKPKHPFTKGKDESCNRFMSWLIPYNGEFETEEDLIKIIENINIKVNQQINETIGVPPIMLFQKEKEYLKPLPNDKILNSYLYDTLSAKVSNESLFYYKGSKYSVPIKFINHTLSLREENNKLYVYYNKDLITMHDISNNYINYKEEHYNEGISTIFKNKTQDEIEEISRNNLNLINQLSEV